MQISNIFGFQISSALENGKAKQANDPMAFMDFYLYLDILTFCL